MSKAGATDLRVLASRDRDLSHRVERLLALSVENPEASAAELKEAERKDRTGKPATSSKSKSANLRIAGHHIPAHKWAEMARFYFENRERPDVSDVEVEVRGTDLSELLGGNDE